MQQLSKNGIFGDWGLAETSVEENPTFRDLGKCATVSSPRPNEKAHGHAGFRKVLAG
jgi:hypothetical protein